MPLTELDWAKILQKADRVFKGLIPVPRGRQTNPWPKPSESISCGDLWPPSQALGAESECHAEGAISLSEVIGQGALALVVPTTIWWGAARLWGRNYERRWPGRLMPNLFIRWRRVLGWRFSSRAAPFGPSTTPPAC
jgi:hypothetical protein